ncbi:MAG: DUF4411 family protein [Candidatus Methanomethylicaceae archaeon]
MKAPPTRYVLDTSVFTQAARSYYHFAIAPGFWKALVQKARAGTLLSIDRVKAEIDKGQDDLKKWVNSHFHYFQSTNDQTIVAAYRQVIQWATAQNQYTPAAKTHFADNDNADAWVVAYARAKNCVVVTQEAPAPQARHKIKLPDVCRGFNVQCIDTFEMMRRLRIRL